MMKHEKHTMPEHQQSYVDLASIQAWAPGPLGPWAPSFRPCFEAVPGELRMNSKPCETNLIRCRIA